MCEKNIADLQVVGSIYIMLICLLAKFEEDQLAEELYMKFQKEIL